MIETRVYKLPEVKKITSSVSRPSDESERLVWRYCTISFNSAGIVTRDGPTEILVSADAKSGRDMAKIFGSLLPEAAKIYAYRFVTENNFGRSP